MKKLIFSGIAVFALLVFGVSFLTADNTSISDYKVGDKVEDFTITNYDGNSYTLSTSGGKATVVMFWSTECPFVQPYTERINSLASTYGPQGIVFWGMNSNQTEDAGTVASHWKEKAYGFTMLKDEKSSVANSFGAQRTPEVFVIDNATMTVVYHGSIDDNKDASAVTAQYLKNALDEYLAGKSITNKETKSFGCGIKRGS
jgi:cytochrome oxidase Cu insertion factor (SCO1/SenC/PrrC family)